jgi:hypothetical protein
MQREGKKVEEGDALLRHERVESGAHALLHRRKHTEVVDSSISLRG